MSHPSVTDALRQSSEDSRQLFPVNYRFRRQYRVLIGFIGLGISVLSLWALTKMGEEPFFGRRGDRVFGVVLNGGAATTWLVLGLALVGGAVIGRNVLAAAATGVGALLLLLGTALLALQRTDANVFAYTVSSVIATYLIGLIVLWCGMHTWVTSEKSRKAMRTRESTVRDYRDADYRRDQTLLP